jgi:P4 family phage/plasmid primase-like protien
VSPPKDTRKAAKQYMAAGLSPIPVPVGEKNPNRNGWQNERHDSEDVEHLWNNGQGVGILWGEPSDDLIDIDCDWPESEIAARYILPRKRTFGRPSSPESHYLVRIVGELPKTRRFKIPGEGDDNCVVELLSTGTQSLVPPSLHSESGERRQWYRQEPAPEMSGDEARDAADDVATAAFIARNWPGKGARHEYALAATGYVGRYLSRDRAERTMYAAIAASRDEEAEKRRRDVRDTLDALEASRPATGGPTLDKLAPGVLDQLKRWHGWRTNSAPEESNGSRDSRQSTRSVGAPSEEKEKKHGIVRLMAEEIGRDEHFARDAADNLYRFSGGVYRQYAERWIRRRVKEVLAAWGMSSRWSSHRAQEVVSYIVADAPDLWDKPPLDEINVKNGILNVGTRELRLHDPGWLSTVQLPMRFDSTAECETWDKLAEECFPKDAPELLFEMAADLMTPDRSHEECILLLGDGGNGKSTVLAALNSFIGSTNTAAMSLHRMESDRFSVARLHGKLANICPDLPSTHLTETTMFKTVTGGDEIDAPVKYKQDPLRFRPYCRLLFSANSNPRSSDASHAFFRRWLVVPFNRNFEDTAGEIPREKLDSLLSSPTELSGALNRALAVFERVRKNGYTVSEKMREAHQEFQSMTDPVAIFLQRYTTQGSDLYVPKDELLRVFNSYQDSQGRNGMTSHAFTKALKRENEELEDRQKTINDRRVWCWFGIGLNYEGLEL